MKDNHNLSFSWITRSFVLGFYLSALAISSLIAGAENSSQINRVYTGLDLIAIDEGLEYEVIGFQRKRMLGSRGGKFYSISMDTPVRYDFVSKMTTRWAEYKLLQMESFSSEYIRDFRALQVSQSQLEFESDRYDVLASSSQRTGSRYSALLNGIDTVPGAPSDAAADALSRIETFDNLRYELETKLQNAEENADALRVKLEITASEDVAKAYVVVLAFYKTRVENEVRQRPLSRVLGKLKARRAQQFSFEFFGFPKGFRVEQLEVHLYSNGIEIPHQDSPGLLQMTDGETFEYLLSKYKRSSGNPEPTLFKPLEGETISSIVSPRELERIKVDLIVRTDGSTSVDFINMDSERTAPRLVDYLEQVRFFPAMENGDLVETKLFVPLTSIVRIN